MAVDRDTEKDKQREKEREVNTQRGGKGLGRAFMEHKFWDLLSVSSPSGTTVN